MGRRARDWLSAMLVAGTLACTPTPEEVMDPTEGPDDTEGDDPEIPASCGNGMLDPGEECEDLDRDDPLDGCLIDCSYGPSGFVTGMPFATLQFGNLQGGSAVPDSCPPGQVLTAMRGQVSGDGWVVRLQGFCGEPVLVPRDDGGYLVEVADGDDLSVHGSGEGTDGFARCPPHQIAVGFGGRAGSVVDQLRLRCAPVFVFDGPLGWELSLGEVTETDAFGGEGGSPIPPTSCGETMGFVATGLRLQAGSLIDAFGLECAPLVLQTGP